MKNKVYRNSYVWRLKSFCRTASVPETPDLFQDRYMSLALLQAALPLSHMEDMHFGRAWDWRNPLGMPSSCAMSVLLYLNEKFRVGMELVRCFLQGRKSLWTTTEMLVKFSSTMQLIYVIINHLNQLNESCFNKNICPFHYCFTMQHRREVFWCLNLITLHALFLLFKLTYLL